ncbi:MAG: flagellar hook capping FlgD N-terminal domain-containing protein [Campylobacterota bacterium]|nr:flagellar hook capping FlgD N-terminal domain-containing protein [Campylobacterota bacterium]
MEIDGVITNSQTGVDGNSYTSSVSNDQLTNEDFLRLMIEEMKMQDPTKPMDSAQLMDSQLQMSSIQANTSMSNAMLSLQSSYANAALSTSAAMIGHIVENGTIGDDGYVKSFQVNSVESRDGELSLNVRQMIGVVDGLKDSQTNEVIQYDSLGVLSDNPDIKVVLDAQNRFTFNEDGTIKLANVSDNEIITDEDIINRYAYAGYQPQYSENIENISMASVTKINS